MAAVPDTPIKGNPEDKIVLKGFGAIGTEACDCSPFVTKLEAYMKFAGLPYEKQWYNSSESPKAMAPYIVHGPNIISDTTLIITYLKNTYGEAIKVKQPSDPFLQGVGLTVQRTVEDHLYYGGLYYRWCAPEGWKEGFVYKDICGPGKAFPWYFKYVGYMLPGTYTKRITAQGLLKHSKRDMESLLEDDIRALSQILGDKDFMLGSEPTECDASVFGYLDCMMYDGIDNDHLKMMKKYDNLVQYTRRIRKKYFDLDE